MEENPDISKTLLHRPLTPAKRILPSSPSASSRARILPEPGAADIIELAQVYDESLFAL